MKKTTIKELELSEILTVAGGVVGGGRVNCRTAATTICDGMGANRCRIVRRTICEN